VALALLCLVPSLGVTLVIMGNASGNHQHMAGHVGQALQFALGFFLLNPAFLLLNLGWGAGAFWLAGGLKLAVVAAGLRRAGPRLRGLLWLLLAYDLGNAALLGIGRYHTGIATAISSRYYYSSLLATLPFVALLLDEGLRAGLRPGIARRLGAALAIGALTWACLRGWPGELAGFTGWRGTDLRRTMAAPAVAGSKEMVPGMDFMHIERSKALVRAYHLH
jgi:hypothetical protein